MRMRIKLTRAQKWFCFLSWKLIWGEIFSKEGIDLCNQYILLPIDRQVLPGRRCVALPFAIWSMCHLLIFFGPSTHQIKVMGVCLSNGKYCCDRKCLSDRKYFFNCEMKLMIDILLLWLGLTDKKESYCSQDECNNPLPAVSKCASICFLTCNRLRRRGNWTNQAEELRALIYSRPRQSMAWVLIQPLKPRWAL